MAQEIRGFFPAPADNQVATKLPASPRSTAARSSDTCGAGGVRLGMVASPAGFDTLKNIPPDARGSISGSVGDEVAAAD